MANNTMYVKILFFVLLTLQVSCGSSSERADKSSDESVVQEIEDASSSEEKISSSSSKEVALPAESSRGSDYKLLSQALRSKSERRAVQEASKHLAKDPNDLKALNALGMFYFSIGKKDMAKIILSRAIKAHKKSAALYNNLGTIYLSEKKYPEAMVQFKQAVALDSKSITANYNLGTILSKFGHYQQALPYLENAYDSLGRKSNAAAHYAEALRGLNRISEAAKVYDRMDVEDSKDSSILMNYAYFLVEQKKDKEQGLKILNKIRLITEDPDILKKAQRLTERVEAIK